MNHSTSPPPSFDSFTTQYKMHSMMDIGTKKTFFTELRCDSQICFCQNRENKSSQQQHTFWQKEENKVGNIFCSDKCVKENWSFCSRLPSKSVRSCP